MVGLSERQIALCVIAERASAVISLLCTTTMFIAFFTIRQFRNKLSNPLIVWASFANLGSTAASLMGSAGLNELQGSVCQSQAFLLEWFMQMDPLFGACMAFNVFLFVFRRWSYHKVRGLTRIYVPICYGLPLIPALIGLVYRNSQKGTIYGGAEIWCWIDDKYGPVRIYSYYLPVWVSIAFTILNYFIVGIQVSRNRRNLRGFGRGGQTHSGLSNSRNGSKNSITRASQPAITGIRTMEVEIISTEGNLIVPAPAHPRTPSSKGEHSVEITASEISSGQTWYDRLGRIVLAMKLDSIQGPYAKCAFLFAISICCTWIPSSANRIWGLKHPAGASFRLSFAASVVLPLQGFWNTFIFFYTSWDIVELEYRKYRRGNRQPSAGFFGSQISLAEVGQGATNNSIAGILGSLSQISMDDERVAFSNPEF